MQTQDTPSQARTHTPGPWRVEAASDGYDIVSSSPGLSATVAITAARPHSETGRADAYLIAAAPDLLAVLKDIIAALRKDAPGTPLNNPRYDALGAAAHAAIAKAEGRS